MSSRSITLKPGYYTGDQITKKSFFHMGGYSPKSENINMFNQLPFGIKRVLSPEIDIFSELPQFVLENVHAKLFLNEMKKVLVKLDRVDLEGTTLSKLRVTEHTESTLVIEWIFNYFRLYFSFDDEEGDFYGEVSIDLKSGKFSNTFNKMEIPDFPRIAEFEVMHAVILAGGNF